MTEYACKLSRSRNILIDFSGNTSPDLYGISIESSTGIVVDNIPQRGSAGLEFTMIGKENLKEAYELLKPDLVVIHYGLNLATTIRNDYSYYEKGLARQIDLLREISPETGLLVIGLTDMAFQDGTRVKSYPNIPKIINAQRNAAESDGSCLLGCPYGNGRPGVHSEVVQHESSPGQARLCSPDRSGSRQACATDGEGSFYSEGARSCS